MIGPVATGIHPVHSLATKACSQYRVWESCHESFGFSLR